jgi:hypothetical protein
MQKMTWVAQTPRQILKINKMRLRHLLLIFLIFLSEAKAIFYNLDMEVSWYLFSDHKRQVCMVVEDYCNIVIFGVVFWYLYKEAKDFIMKQVALFLFTLNALDFVHLGLYDMEGFILLKLIISFLIYRKLWLNLKR